MNLPVHAVLW